MADIQSGDFTFVPMFGNLFCIHSTCSLNRILGEGALCPLLPVCTGCSSLWVLCIMTARLLCASAHWSSCDMISAGNVTAMKNKIVAFGYRVDR